MDLQLSGKIAVVTGAGRGIGLATTRCLLAEGARVLGVSRTLTTELESSGATTLAADLSTAAGADAVATWVRDHDAAVDLLVNNVGGGSGGETDPFLAVTDETWAQMLDVNLMSAVRMSRALLPRLVEGGGAIVNVGSIGGLLPAGPPIAYNVSKAALRALSKGLAEEFGPQGVRVNTVAPGPVRTDVWAGPSSLGAHMAEAVGVPQEQLLEQLPGMFGMVTGRLTDADEVAALIAFLLSPLAASITGAEYRIDGSAVKVV